MRPALTAATLLLATTLPAAAAPPGERGLWDALTLESVLRQVVDWTMISGRMLAELRYDRAEVDVMSGTLTVRGLYLGDMEALPGCVIEAGALTLGDGGLLRADRFSGGLDAHDLRLTPECLGPDGRAMLATLGLRGLALPRATLDLRYDVPGGGATLTAEVTATDLGSLTLAGEFDYLGLRVAGSSGPGGEVPPDEIEDGDDDVALVGRLAYARVAFADDGLTEKLRPMLGSDLFEATVAGWLAAAPAEWPPEAEPLMADAAREIAAFLAAPDRLTLELRPEAPVPFDTRDEDSDGWALLLAARPQLAPALPPRRQLLPAATLAQVLADPAAASAEDRRRVGLALATGEGAPRDPARAAALLGDTAADAEAALALAMALTGRDDAAAYARAQQAAAAGAAAAPAVLDRLEARLGLPAVLALQPGLPAPAEDLATVTTAADLCARAEDRRRGAGIARDYALAAAWAGLGTAAGEPACDVTTRTIETRMARLLDPAAWHTARDAAGARALDAWIAADMPARLMPD